MSNTAKDILDQINSLYSTGQRFEISPNATTIAEYGQVKNKRYVIKQ